MIGCSNKGKAFEEVKGVALTYSEFFKPFDRLDERKKITYYKPIGIEELESFLPEQLTKEIMTIDSKKLPFEVDDAKVFLVSSEDDKGDVKNQVQLSYISKDENDVDGFFNISVTEVDENPIEGYPFSDEVDSVGNQFKKEILTDELPIFQQIITTNSALVYRYYESDESKERIVTVATSANEIYSYYNGFVYHIGYYIDSGKGNKEIHNEMLKLAREYILGNSL
ncbi:hypothetical protein [Bacillus sp. PS06]|uniref:hypothetical protein n=1 Tax=Bacillus sp. PS06 TaxID=2764176 RepID=UPI00178120FA|nr:hypothetical protein [Bacillus sp. PS06]MBD8070040.1 hypothetical protein [Bacillus sp. PS06]